MRCLIDWEYKKESESMEREWERQIFFKKLEFWKVKSKIFLNILWNNFEIIWENVYEILREFREYCENLCKLLKNPWKLNNFNGSVGRENERQTAQAKREISK